MGAFGIAASFFSHELLRLAGAAVQTPTVLLMQVCGALYVGFAFLNWYLRSFVIGGIYNRPLALANLLHFAVVAVTLVKAAPAMDSIRRPRFERSGPMRVVPIWAKVSPAKS